MIRAPTRHAFVVCLGLLALASPAGAQTVDTFPTSDWCGPDNTICWSESDVFSGVRLSLDLAVTYAFQFGDNRFETAGLEALPRFGVETNLFRGWLGLHAGLIAPGAVRIDEHSPLRDKFQDDEEIGELPFTLGWTAGLSFFNGTVAVGYGRLSYDLRGVPLVEGESLSGSDGADGFIYLSLGVLQSLMNSQSND